jgi:hypothetical protein
MSYNNIEYNDDIMYLQESSEYHMLHADIFKNYSQMAQRMAFYAGVWNAKTKKFTIPLEKAVEYGENILAAMELEYIRIDKGFLPRKLTTDVVDELILNLKNKV